MRTILGCYEILIDFDPEIPKVSKHMDRNEFKFKSRFSLNKCWTDLITDRRLADLGNTRETI